MRNKIINQIIKDIDCHQDEILSNLDKESIAVYLFLKNEYAKGDIINNLVFQFIFRSYYRLDNAGLSYEIKRHFFELLAKNQTNLKIILSQLYAIPTLKNKNTIQFCFATKLLHTINNNNPIFDSEVAKITRKKVTGFDKDTKINSCIEIYDSLKKLYSELIENKKVKKVISKFKLKFNINIKDISDVKVLDFIIWSLGKIKKKKS